MHILHIHLHAKHLVVGVVGVCSHKTALLKKHTKKKKKWRKSVTKKKKKKKIVYNIV